MQSLWEHLQVSFIHGFPPPTLFVVTDKSDVINIMELYEAEQRLRFI